MKNAKRILCAMLCLVMAVSVVLPFAANAAQFAVYAYCTLDGAVYGDANVVYVEEGTTSLGSGEFLVPEGYHPLAASADVDAENNAYLPIAKNETEPELIMFTIVIMEGTKVVNNNAGRISAYPGTITIADIAKQYKARPVVSVSEDAENGIVYGYVEAEAPEFKTVDVSFVCGEDVVGSTTVEVPFEANWFVMDTLKAPDGYEVLNPGHNAVINADNKAVVAVKKLGGDIVPPTKKVVDVTFVCGEETVGSTQLEVAVEATEFTMNQVTAPAGYALVNPDHKAPIEADNRAVVAVKKLGDDNDGGSSITRKIVYVTFVCGEETVGSAQLEVAINATEFVMNEVTAPAGYALVNPDHKAPIDAENNAIVAVKKLGDDNEGGSSITGKIVYVTFVCGEEPVGSEQVTVAPDQTKLAMKGLNVPEGYALVNPDHFAVIDDEDNAYVAVKKIDTKNDMKTVNVFFVAPGDKTVGSTTVELAVNEYKLLMNTLTPPAGYHLVNPDHYAVIDGENNAYVAVDTNKVDGNKDDVPKTGDESAVLLMTTLCVVFMGAAAVLVSMKKSENR